MILYLCFKNIYFDTHVRSFTGPSHNVHQVVGYLLMGLKYIILSCKIYIAVFMLPLKDNVF